MVLLQHQVLIRQLVDHRPYLEKLAPSHFRWRTCELSPSGAARPKKALARPRNHEKSMGAPAGFPL